MGADLPPRLHSLRAVTTAALLFVVDRNDSARYEYLRRALGGDEGVAVILDRRNGERRTSRARIPNDRRLGDRRIRENHHELARLGYALIQVQQ